MTTLTPTAEIDRLKHQVNLRDLVERTLGEAPKQNGHGWRCRCPWHGGKNPTTFSVWYDNAGWHYKCFAGCGSGDIFTFIMKNEGKTFAEALALLAGPEVKLSQPPAPTPKPEPGPPNAVWQLRAQAFIAEAQANLWGAVGEKALYWLRAQRGLNQSTIARAQLGYWPRDTYAEPGAWGLGERQKKIWFPRGIVIPWLDGETVWAINTRRPAGKPKYFKVAGSQGAIFGALGQHPVAIFTEGEFDALLLAQEASDLVNVATVGATRHVPGEPFISRLLALHTILVSVDNDPEGEQTKTSWLELTHRARFIRPLHGKDITDFYLAGGDLRSWVNYQLAKIRN